MKTQTKAATALFGGATALVLTLGLGGVGVSPVGGAATTAAHQSTAAAPAHPNAAPAAGTVVHTATLTACVSGLDC
ncbi:hypothetical protein [Mycobacterium sp. 852002-51057_SCH5723018]|uniref:hypothetical protein n=1 Tax=Mycobacterium sp. 852002-51057_SCH5723018 TaxID=1834094 RepID=UPI0008008B75|nr:hypothetical protein [Mycobacterium sp. 852002-51057_SCH5723018]OBG18723.1 hypothetical protein A5764_18150 [Mycobacterium sp. 852002-51057_SCH5723018]